MIDMSNKAKCKSALPATIGVSNALDMHAVDLECYTHAEAVICKPFTVSNNR